MSMRQVRLIKSPSNNLGDFCYVTPVDKFFICDIIKFNVFKNINIYLKVNLINNN